MPIDLLNLQPQKISKNLKGKYILLYGLPGVGKTSLASEFNNVLIAGFEMGTNALNNVYVQPIKTWKDWRDMVKQLCKEEALQNKFDSIAIDTADVILFMTDVKQGLVDSDAKVADMLRRAQKPVILVVNKVDNYNTMMADVYEFYNLGIGDPYAISAANRTGLGDLLDEVVKFFPETNAEEEEDDR